MCVTFPVIMGFLDLSTTVAAKKHVDFNDARYQLADKLKQTEKQAVRASFTLYDKTEERMSIQELEASYNLSDKHLPIGEIINKMLDIIVDLEDGVLDSANGDAIYIWKYSNALLDIFEDKRKRQEPLTTFDNSLKNIIVETSIFNKKYPGKYTYRTNFFDPKLREEIVTDMLDTFKNDILAKIHTIAVTQSKEIAEKHQNKTMDVLINWAIQNYNCKVDAFFDVKENKETSMFYSINTVILHLPNGYDISLVGYVGTDRDDKFAVSIINARNSEISESDSRVNKNDVKSIMANASQKDPLEPLSKLIKIENAKKKVLQESYEILKETRPMVKEEVLKIKAASSVVGNDYIWGCEQFRKTHDDLPDDFDVKDIILPKFEYVDEDEKEALKNSTEPLSVIPDEIHQALANHTKKANETVFNAADTSRAAQQKENEAFDIGSILLPGFMPTGNKNDNDKQIPSVTASAQKKEYTQPASVMETPNLHLPTLNKDSEGEGIDTNDDLGMDEFDQPNLFITDMDSLFEN